MKWSHHSDVIELQLIPFQDQNEIIDIIQNEQTKPNRLNEPTTQKLTTKNDILK